MAGLAQAIVMGAKAVQGAKTLKRSVQNVSRNINRYNAKQQKQRAVARPQTVAKPQQKIKPQQVTKPASTVKPKAVAKPQQVAKPQPVAKPVNQKPKSGIKK